MNKKYLYLGYLKMSLKKLTEYKMKNIFILFTLIISILLTVSLHGQTDYVVSATNGVLVDNYNYEFDIYLLSTGTMPLELATFQVSIYFNEAISDSGTLSAEYIAETSTLEHSNQFPNPPNLTFTSEGGLVRQLRIAPKTPPGTGNGSVISNVEPGTRFGRFRITSSVPFDTAATVNWQWNYTSDLNQYSSYLNAYINSTNTNISNPSKFIMNLNYRLSSIEFLSANIKVFLEGSYTGGQMGTLLNTSGFIPTSQPFNNPPWNYTGTETVTTVPENVTDWILVELRSDETTVVDKRAAFIKNNGTLIDLNGVSNIKFPTATAGNYYRSNYS